MTDPTTPAPVCTRPPAQSGTFAEGPWLCHCPPPACTALHPRATHIRARRPRNRSIYPRHRAPRPPHQRRRDRGGGPAGAAARAAGGRGRRARRHRAGRQPLRHRALDHHAPPAVGRGDRLRRRHRRLRDRRHAGRLRALRLARADRRLHRRPDRLRHQPRLQPRRRHHLLGHRRRRARGRDPRHPGHRGLPAVQRARDGLPPRRPLRLRRRRRVHRAAGGGDRRRAAAGGHAAQRQRARPARSTASRSRSLGKRIYRDQLSLVNEESGRKQYRIYGDAPELRRRGRHRPGRDRRAAGSRSRRCTSTSPTGPGSRRCRPTTSRGCSRRRRAKCE